MRACKNCRRDISHRVTPGPGRKPIYCDEIDNPDCYREREAKRKALKRALERERAAAPRRSRYATWTRGLTEAEITDIEEAIAARRTEVEEGLRNHRPGDRKRRPRRFNAAIRPAIRPLRSDHAGTPGAWDTRSKSWSQAHRHLRGVAADAAFVNGQDGRSLQARDDVGGHRRSEATRRAERGATRS